MPITWKAKKNQKNNTKQNKKINNNNNIKTTIKLMVFSTTTHIPDHRLLFRANSRFKKQRSKARHTSLSTFFKYLLPCLLHYYLNCHTPAHNSPTCDCGNLLRLAQEQMSMRTSLQIALWPFDKENFDILIIFGRLKSGSQLGVAKSHT